MVAIIRWGRVSRQNDGQGHPTPTINAYYTDSEVNYSDEFEYYITAVDANNNESSSSETLSILAIYYGDANGDELLNILDLVLIANMLLENDYDTISRYE